MTQASAKSGENVDRSARVSALDYLGTVASRLRKDAIAVSIDDSEIDSIISLVGVLCADVPYLVTHSSRGQRE